MQFSFRTKYAAHMALHIIIQSALVQSSLFQDRLITEYVVPSGRRVSNETTMYDNDNINFAFMAIVLSGPIWPSCPVHNVFIQDDSDLKHHAKGIDIT